MTDNEAITRLEAHDGAHLFCQRYTSPDPVGVILAIHDFGQHSEAYARVYETFAHQNLSVYAMDLRGHGKSGGERGNVLDFSDYLDDLDLLVARAKDREAERPIFLLGFGLGAIVALRFSVTRKPKLHGVVLCGTLPLLPTNSREKLISQYAGMFLKRVDANEEARSILLSTVLEDKAKLDELTYRGAVKAKTVAEINAANSLSQIGNEFLSFPVLSLTSESHRNIDERIFDKILSHDKTILEFESHARQPMLGPERDRLVGEIVTWCKERLESIDDEEEWGDPEDDSL